MAPMNTNKSNKRRRGEDEVRRPKKKVKKFVKRQTEYHSDSEDEDGLTITALDAPPPQPKDLEGANAVPVQPRLTPRPILKKNGAVQQPSRNKDAIPDEDDSERMAFDETRFDSKEDELAYYELMGNTMSNMAAGQNDTDFSSDEDAADGVPLDEVAKHTASNAAPETESASEADEDDNDEPSLASDSDADSDSHEPDSDDNVSMTSSTTSRQKKKRNDPTAFATSLSRILTTKLTTSKRTDPVLSRSASAAEANKSLAEAKISSLARAQIRAERKSALDKGRVKDVLGLESEGVDTGKILEEEKRLKKTAQRGVVKLFNAVRAAQVKAEEAGRVARAEGVVGMAKREEKVNEMSKQGFLDLISRGGKEGVTAA